MFFGIIAYSLFIFWMCGIISILIDCDHIFCLIGRKPCIKFSESYGRPFHTRTIFILVAFFVSIFVVSYVYGFYRGILFGIGEREVLLLMISLNLITYFGSKYLGSKFMYRLVRQRWKWRQEKKRNIKNV